MSRRFSNEPINLIRRIPSPEQLDAARSVTRPVGGKLGETAASFARSVGELLAHIGNQRAAAGTAESREASQEEVDELPAEVSGPEYEPPDREMAVAEPHQPISTEAAYTEAKTHQSGHASTAWSSIQPDELAELRGYLLSQQQDIARLTAQIQELKSLVMSQQQIIERLGKEVEIGPRLLVPMGMTSARARQNRLPRPKPMMNEKEIGSEGDSMRLPLNV